MPPAGRAARRRESGLMRSGLTIGEFATVTHLSVRTLRRYHEAGLLQPATVNPFAAGRGACPAFALDDLEANSVADMPGQAQAFRNLGQLGGHDELVRFGRRGTHDVVIMVSVSDRDPEQQCAGFSSIPRRHR